MERKREVWIDYTKVLACILVVIGHLLQGLNKANIEWNDTLYEYINMFIYLFHMPLFMCLSGYLYKKTSNIENIKDYKKFVLKKLVNLGVPYISFYLLYVMINMLFSSSVNTQMGINEVFSIFTKPIAPFWFLYALFFIFLLIPILEKIWLKNINMVLLTTIVLYIFNIFIKTNVYVIDIVFQYSFYFYLGVFIYNQNIKKAKMRFNVINIIIYILLSILFYYLTSKSSNLLLCFYNYFMGIYGVIISLFVFKSINLEKSTIWNFLSRYTFQIYLTHTIFTAGARIILLKLSITNFYIHLLTGLTAGIIGPIFLAFILNKIKYGNIVFFPLKTIKDIKNNS